MDERNTVEDSYRVYGGPRRRMSVAQRPEPRTDAGRRRPDTEPDRTLDSDTLPAEEQPVGRSALLPRLLTGVQPGRQIGLAEHDRLHGPPANLPAAAVIETADRAGLRGRGGARFPTARKLRTVAAAGRPLQRPIVVVNGMEGEPLAGKDRLLLDSAPHLVLDGAALAAAAVGAREAIVCIPSAAGATHAGLERALEERRCAGRDRVKFEIAEMDGGFVASEETALVQQLNGGPAVPTFTPPRPFERGVKRRPTLIDNAETLAHLALIGRHGAEWFRRIGDAADPGSVLVTLSGAVAAPGVYEIAPGTSMKQLVAAAGGLTESIRALLIGGYYGSWVDGRQADSLILNAESLHHHGAALGAGVIVVLPDSACGAAEAARIGDYLARESAGQCGACVNGLAAIADALAQLVDGTPKRGSWADLQRWLEEVPGRGACKFPDGATRFMSSALQVFGHEFHSHATHGPCEACYRRAVLVRPRGHELQAAA